jgi:MoaA/NifB/PqqE/SkfB family radical SAM enzyme
MGSLLSRMMIPRIKEAAPIDYCELIVTEKCFFRCIMCEMWKSTKIETMTLESWKSVVDDLRPLTRPGQRLGICGGETLLYKDLASLIRYSTEKGFFCYITTNGYMLDKQAAEELHSAGLREVNISVDSHDPAVHDHIRGKSGSFQKAMEAIDILKGYQDMQVTVLAVVMNQNVGHLEELADMCKRKSVTLSLNAITEPLCSGEGDSWHVGKKFGHLWPDADTAEKSIRRMIKIKKQGYDIANPIPQLEAFMKYFRDPDRIQKKGACQMGRGISINPEGYAFMCHKFGTIGNVLSISFRNIWDSQTAKTQRDSILQCDTNCKMLVNCNPESAHGEKK